MYSMIIVDDEYFTIEGMKLIIDWSFYNIEIVGTAVSGREGIALAKRLKPDIILSDIRMFGMDGISMLDTIRQEGIESKFIIMSGYKQFEYAQRAIEVGIEGYLLKPVNKEYLISIVQKITSSLGIEQKKEPEYEENIPESRFHEIISYIDGHYCDNITLQKISEMFYINSGYLSRMFKAETGESYVNYVTNKKMERAKSLLMNKDLSITEIANILSYKDINYFSSLFKKQVGMSPQKYHKLNAQAAR
ncbi:MAG: response regulator [Clostridia bacterium]|nr:response regulator [Clostridia bacterium]